MNELEKEIEEKVSGLLHPNKEYLNVYKHAFKQGCNFILEKNLPVLFAEWVDENCHYHSKGFFWMQDEHGIKTTLEIYDYWLNNVYGK